jgi:5-methylcytosine-specific restriction endonuclease McrA
MAKCDGRSGYTWKKVTAQLRRESTPICWICGRDIDMRLHYLDAMAWTADHKVPRVELIANGEDPNDINNLAPAHRRCNSIKGAGPAPLRAKGSRRW